MPISKGLQTKLATALYEVREAAEAEGQRSGAVAAAWAVADVLKEADPTFNKAKFIMKVYGR